MTRLQHRHRSVRGACTIADRGFKRDGDDDDGGFIGGVRQAEKTGCFVRRAIRVEVVHGHLAGLIGGAKD